MKVYKKIILDKNNKVIYEDSYDYKGNWSYLGIHYDFKVREEPKQWKSKPKREKKQREKLAKKQAKKGFEKEKEQDKTVPLDQVITLDHLTNPDKK